MIKNCKQKSNSSVLYVFTARFLTLIISSSTDLPLSSHWFSRSKLSVLGVEYCTAYTNKNGSVVKGFYCHLDQMIFCCGNKQHKYCCTQADKFAQQIYQLENQGSQASVLNQRAVSMVSLFSAAILTFLITIMLTVIIINTCQRVIAKKFRSNCTGICLANSCNNINATTGNDLYRTLSASILPATSLTTTALLINNQTMNNVNNNLSVLNTLPPTNTLVNNVNDQINYSGPITNLSDTSTDQCTIDTNSTLFTNLSDTSNSSYNCNLNSNLSNNLNNNLNSNNLLIDNTNNQPNLDVVLNAVQQQQQPSSSFNRLTNAIASFTNLLTNNSNSQRNQLATSDNSLFHISGNDQLNDQLTNLIITQPPPPSYDTTTQEIAQENYQIQLSSSYYSELCT